jgi:hypothetical protein
MSVRSAIDQIMIIAGVLIIVTPVALLEPESWTPLVLVFVGIAFMGLGVYRVGHRMLPNRRVYVGLRSEIEFFINMARKLNMHALLNDTDAVEALRDEMKESVDRMVSLAGRPGQHKK